MCHHPRMRTAHLKKALAHLSKDARMKKLITMLERPKSRDLRDPFTSLCRSIIYQQLSGTAAGTIHRRFMALYRTASHPSPKQVARTPSLRLKTAGLSTQKASYLIDLAEKFLDGTVDPKNFHRMTDDEIRKHLIAVRGIGRWTADMFLMFTLERPDVLPTGDLGVQKGMQRFFGLRKLPSPKQMEKLAKSWRPYRTVASRYLWKSLDNQ